MTNPTTLLTLGLVLPWLAATGSAQEPRPPAAGLVLLHLQTLLDGGVYALVDSQSAQTAPRPPGGAAAVEPVPRLFARLQDARFERDGRLLELVVAAPTNDPRDPFPQRSLPAAAVRWDATRRLWILVSPTMQLQELERVGARAEGRPAAGTWLASHLQVAQLATGTVAEPAVAADGKPKPPTPLRILLAAEPQRLAMVLVPIPAVEPAPLRHVAVPWSQVRLVGTADGTRIGFTGTPGQLATAPACEAATLLPDAALRQRSYAHFAITAPGWDAPVAAPASAPPAK